MKVRYKGLVVKCRPNGKFIIPHLGGGREYNSVNAAKAAITRSGR